MVLLNINGIKMKQNNNTNILLMVLWTTIWAFLKDDLNEDAMTALMSSIGSTTGLPSNLDAVNRHHDTRVDTSEYIYGIRGLADYLGVSGPTAQKYVNSGKLDPAIRRVGKKYSFRKAIIDELFTQK